MTPPRWRRSGLLGVLALAASAALRPTASDATEAPADATVLADRVVAVVGRTPILASQVALEQAIRNRVRLARDRADFGRLLVEPAPPLEAIILREAIRGQALWDAVGEAPQDRVQARVDAFVRTFLREDEAAVFARSWGLSDDELRLWFADTVRADLCVIAAVDPLVEPSPKDERLWYEQHRDDIFAGRPFEDVSALVAQQVYERAFQRHWQSWGSQIRAAARVRYVGRPTGS